MGVEHSEEAGPSKGRAQAKKCTETQHLRKIKVCSRGNCKAEICTNCVKPNTKGAYMCTLC